MKSSMTQDGFPHGKREKNDVFGGMAVSNLEFLAMETNRPMKPS